MNLCNSIRPYRLERIFRGMLYDKTSKAIYRGPCSDFIPIGKVKDGKIYWDKKQKAING